MNNKLSTYSNLPSNEQQPKTKGKSNKKEIVINYYPLIIKYESFKNTFFVNDTSQFFLSIYNNGTLPIVDLQLHFNFSDNIFPIASSVYLNNRYLAFIDLNQGIKLSNLSSYETAKLRFLVKSKYPFINENAFSQALVGYSYYVNDRKIGFDVQSDLISLKVVG